MSGSTQQCSNILAPPWTALSRQWTAGRDREFSQCLHQHSRDLHYVPLLLLVPVGLIFPFPRNMMGEGVQCHIIGPVFDHPPEGRAAGERLFHLRQGLQRQGPDQPLSLQSARERPSRGGLQRHHPHVRPAGGPVHPAGQPAGYPWTFPGSVSSIPTHPLSDTHGAGRGGAQGDRKGVQLLHHLGLQRSHCRLVPGWFLR